MVLTINKSKDFLFKVFITLDSKCNLFPTDVLLAECSFEKKKGFKNISKIALLKHPKYCWEIVF